MGGTAVAGVTRRMKALIVVLSIVILVLTTAWWLDRTIGEL